MTWYQAGTMLEKQRQQNVDTSKIASIPFFDNLFPANLVGIMNADPSVQGDCGSSASTPCFNPSWTPTQMFYGLQSRARHKGTIPTRSLRPMTGQTRKRT